MTEQNFNPVIEAVVSIRHLASSTVNNWNTMNNISAGLKNDIEKASILIEHFSSEESKLQWTLEMNAFNNNIDSLKAIMKSAIEKIKNKNANNISQSWNTYPKYAAGIEQNYINFKNIGEAILPENKKLEWYNLWLKIHEDHLKIKSEAEACSLQLKMIETYNPEEIDDITETILKHIPLQYSKEEAQQYSEEYIKAYEAIKEETSQKKNLWDKFLDILAGGTQQTPAQRVMMQRWVNGEKGEAH